MFDIEAKTINIPEHKDLNVGSIWQYTPEKNFFPNKDSTESSLFLITEINSKKSYVFTKIKYVLGKEQETQILIPRVIAMHLKTKNFIAISLLENPELWRKVI